MKNLFLAFSLFLLGTAVGVAQPKVSGGAEISFEKDVHDFGNVKQGGDATYDFKFTNNGTEPLIISNAQGSCGCTVPVWPQQPIKPGETQVVKVKYDSNRVGPINKSVTITSNSTSSPTTVIRIKGNIEAAQTEQTVPVMQTPQAAPVAK